MGEIDGAGVIVASGTGVDMGGVVTAVAAGDADGAIDGLGRGLVTGGRTGTEADAAGVGVTAVTGVVVGPAGVGLAALTAGVVLGLGRGRVLGELAGVALAAAAAVALGVVAAGGGVGVAAGAALATTEGDATGVVAAVAAGVAEAVAVVLSVGLTNFLGGALGGGVDSVRIFVRARSAADRSAIVQPLSTLTSTTRSRIRRGRGISRISVMTGTEISSSSPRTIAAVSVFLWRRRR